MGESEIKDQWREVIVFSLRQYDVILDLDVTSFVVGDTRGDFED
jgi:hypothetical protein